MEPRWRSGGGGARATKLRKLCIGSGGEAVELRSRGGEDNGGMDHRGWDGKGGLLDVGCPYNIIIVNNIYNFMPFFGHFGPFFGQLRVLE